MASLPLDLAAEPCAPVGARRHTTIGDFCTLAKARLSALVVATSAVGYLMAASGPISGARLLITVLGTALAAASANAFNQIVEVERDRRMVRTRQRPLPAGRLTRRAAITFAVITGVAGPLLLAGLVNMLTAGLALLCLAIYVLVYTPMKTRSPGNTLVGAVCGALPPMMGWAAVTGGLELGAWLLGGVLFVWQIPHFLALAWLYRDDYARGGFRMLPLYDPAGGLTCQVTLLYCLTLIPLGLMFTLAGLSGWFFAAGSVPLAGLLVGLSLRHYRARDAAAARALFRATLLYLPLFKLLLVLDRPTPPIVDIRVIDSGPTEVGAAPALPAIHPTDIADYAASPAASEIAPRASKSPE
ncbi:MAG: heme o synthase [Phycisphaerae bacterium]